MGMTFDPETLFSSDNSTVAWWKGASTRSASPMMLNSSAVSGVMSVFREPRDTHTGSFSSCSLASIWYVLSHCVGTSLMSFRLGRPICCCTWASFSLAVVLDLKYVTICLDLCLIDVSAGIWSHDFFTNKFRVCAMHIECRIWRIFVDAIMFAAASVTRHFTLLVMAQSSIMPLVTWAKLSAVWLCGKYCTLNTDVHNCIFSLM